MVLFMVFIRHAKLWTSKLEFHCLEEKIRKHSFICRRQAALCILAESCDEPQYKKLITALCNEHQIPLIRVDSNKKLGEWSGLCKIDKEGKPRKVCGCSVVVIKVSWFIQCYLNDSNCRCLFYLRISAKKLKHWTLSKDIWDRQTKRQCNTVLNILRKTEICFSLKKKKQRKTVAPLLDGINSFCNLNFC